MHLGKGEGPSSAVGMRGHELKGRVVASLNGEKQPPIRARIKELLSSILFKGFFYNEIWRRQNFLSIIGSHN